MKKWLSHWTLVFVFVASLAICWPLVLQGYFSHHDDLQVMRIFEMRKCFQDLQIPCRWVPDLGYGYGFPLFNYYGVFPYVIGAILSFVFGYVWAAKMLFLIPLLFGGVGMYLLVLEITKDRWAGLLAGVVFAYAPYRALDSFARGAVSESFAIALVPFVFWLFAILAKSKSVLVFCLAAISLTALLTSHNIMTIFFLPVLVLWIGFLCIFNTGLVTKESIWRMCLVFLLGVGLSAFFVIPAYVEKSLVQTENLTRFDLDFRVHFVTVKQLFFDRAWGWGASVLGPWDGISFQVGWPLWWLAVLDLCLMGFWIWKKGFKVRFLVLNLLFILIFGFSLFMTHNKSAFVWEGIGIIQYSQFPWRFLSVAIFSGSILVGLAVVYLRREVKFIFVGAFAVLAIALNFGYFVPEKFYPDVDDEVKLSGKLWEDQTKASIQDYLPKGAVEPIYPAPSGPVVIEGVASVGGFNSRSNSWTFRVEASTAAKVEVPVFYFPNWEVSVNGKPQEIVMEGTFGRIGVDVPQGMSLVEGRFRDTLVRSVANVISVLSLVVLVAIIIYGKTRKTTR